MSDVTVLHLTALTLGLIHTLVGPDHYVPFVAMAKSGRWTLSKTLWITSLCGIGHVAGSVFLGLLGILLGFAVERLEVVESVRSSIAGWLLLGFGLVYFVGGMIRGLRGVPHDHWHAHTDGTVHQHVHSHVQQHLHVHAQSTNDRGSASEMSTKVQVRRLGTWALFIVFLFGPCEPLIPLLMYPASNSHWLAVVGVTTVFMLATLLTMLLMVAALFSGAVYRGSPSIDRFGHAIAGFAITSCGLAIKIGF